MAVTLTVDALRNALRTGNSDEETTEITRLLGYATAVVDREVGAAVVPQAVQNEAAVRIAAYLYDMPSASRGAAYAHVTRNSGAAAMLLPYRVHRATSTGAESGESGESGTGTGPAARLPQTATPEEAAEGTGNFLRSWTASLIRTAIDAVVPNPGPSQAGRVFSIGADGTRFWDLARDVLIRAIGSLTGQKGKFLVVSQAEDDIVLDGDVAALARIPASPLPDPAAGTRGHFLKQSDTDETYVFDQAAGVVDQTARTAAAASQTTADMALLEPATYGLNHVDVSLLKHIPATHTLTPSTTILVYLVSDHTFQGLDSAAKYRALAWQTTSTENNLRNAYRLLYRVPLADVGLEKWTRGYALHQVSGQASLNEDFSKDVRTERFRDSDYVYFASQHYAVHVKQDGTGYDHSWRFQDYSITVAIDLAHLAAAVSARLLPTGAAKDQLARYDGSKWVAITPDEGGGGPSTRYVDLVTNPTKDANTGAWNVNTQTGTEAEAVFDAYVSGSYRWIGFVNLDESGSIEYVIVFPVLPNPAGTGLTLAKNQAIYHSYVSNAEARSDEHALSGYLRILFDFSGTKSAFLTVNRLGSGGKLDFDKIVGIV
ncbi:MAG: hypothetical protein OXR67_08480 [Chloroflexota bacterium]|nr:hypothetical protein [Chloroflexota bacterium]